MLKVMENGTVRCPTDVRLVSDGHTLEVELMPMAPGPRLALGRGPCVEDAGASCRGQ